MVLWGFLANFCWLAASEPVLVLNGFDDTLGETPEDYWVDQIYRDGALARTFTSDGVQGSGSMQVQYTVVQTESWGGQVSFNHKVEGQGIYCLSGATHISFWFRNMAKQSAPGRAHLRFILSEASDCPAESDCNNPAALETYYSFHQVLDDETDEWKRVSIELRGGDDSSDPFWRTGWMGQAGNHQLDASFVKGFSFEVSIDGGGELESTSSGLFLLDGLEASGPQVLSCPFELTNMLWQQGIDHGVWQPFGSAAQWGISTHAHEGMQALSHAAGDVVDNQAGLAHILPRFAYYNLTGVSDVTIWVKSESFPSPPSLRFVLYDGAGCGTQQTCTSQDVEQIGVLNQLDSAGWTPLRASRQTLSSIATGSAGDGVFDMQVVRGFHLEILNATTEATIVIDGLTPDVPESADSTAFVLTSFDESSGPIPSTYWLSEVYKDGDLTTKSVLDHRHGDGSLMITYKVVQTESWGGQLALSHKAAGSMTYCLEGATQISFWFNNVVPQSNPGRAHLRLILADSSHCTSSCASDEALELYYSFHQVLDDEPGWKQIIVDLVGGDAASLPFWRTGWMGQVGNQELDLAFVKGFRFEVSIDGQDGIGTTSAGSFLVDGLQATGPSVLRCPFASGPDALWFHAGGAQSAEVTWSETSFSHGGMSAKSGQFEIAGMGSTGYGIILPPAAYYNMSRASDLLLWVQVVVPTDSGKLEVVLLESSQCTAACTDPGSLARFTFSFPSDSLATAGPWQQLHMPFADFNGSSQLVAAEVNINVVKGFELRVANTAPDKELLATVRFDGLTATRGTDAKQQCSARPLVHTDNTIVLCSFDTSVGPMLDFWQFVAYKDGSITHEYVESPLAQGNGAMRVMYDVKQTESWGGQADFVHKVDGTYCLTGATHISFWFRNEVAQSAPGRAHLRLLLTDASDCQSDCGNAASTETYFSFHQVLDNEPGEWKKVSIELRGGDDSSDPFWRTGWIGQAGNHQLDVAFVNGFMFQISIDGGGEIGSGSAGSFLIDGLEVSGPQILKAPFDLSTWTWVQSVAASVWSPASPGTSIATSEVHFRTGRSALLSSFELDPNSVSSVNHSHMLPEFAYYNLSGAADLSLWLRVQQAVDVPGATFLRVALLQGQPDSGDLVEGHVQNSELLEHATGWQELRIVLSPNSQGQELVLPDGTESFNTEILRGFRLEIGLHDETSSATQGEVIFDGFSTSKEGHSDEAALVLSSFDTSVGSVEDFWQFGAYKDGSIMHEYVASPLVQGNGAMRVVYDVKQTESWGGQADFVHKVDGTYCLTGATHVSFWFRNEVAQSATGRAHLRLLLTDASDCQSDCGNAASTETYFSFHQVLDDEPGEWKKVSIELRGGEDSSDPFWRTGWIGQAGNKQLDVAFVNGFMFQISIDGGGEIGSGSAGSFFIDGFQVTGPAVLNSMLDVADVQVMQNGMPASIWQTEARSHFGMTSLSGQIQTTAGTAVVATHKLPPLAYYNLSTGVDLSLWIMSQIGGEPGRIRFVTGLLNNHSGSLNVFAANHSPSELAGVWKQLKVPFDGLTAQDGSIVEAFNKEAVVGLQIEIWDDGDDGALETTTSFMFSDLASLSYAKEEVICGGAAEETETVEEIEMFYKVDELVSYGLISMPREELLGYFHFVSDVDVCATKCRQNPDCVYFEVSPLQCCLHDRLRSDAVQLRDQTTVWTGGYLPERRQQACDVCFCHDNGVVDCSRAGRELNASRSLSQKTDLTILPIFSEEVRTTLTSLILADTDVSYITFDLLGATPRLTDLDLGYSVAFVDTEIFRQNLQLTSVHAPNGLGGLLTDLRNQRFRDICCSPGEAQLMGAIMARSCERVEAVAGVDCVHEEFVEYTSSITEIKGVNDYDQRYGWATVTAGDCCDFCASTPGCTHYIRDARWQADANKCRAYLAPPHGDLDRMQPHQGSAEGDTGAFECPGFREGTVSVGDCAGMSAEQMLPGYISGYTAATRASWGDVQLRVSANSLILDEANGFQGTYTVSIQGEMKRGAVWVSPEIEFGLGVEVIPAILPFYGGLVEEQEVHVRGDGKALDSFQLILKHGVFACDQAWMELDKAIITNVAINVMPAKGPAGKYCPPGSKECLVCPRGKFCPAGTIDPLLCPPGTYNPSTGAFERSQCIECSSGTSQAQQGQPQCDECKPGEYANETGASVCEACGMGTYQTQSGQSVCSDCDEVHAGASTVLQGATRPDQCQCPAGSFLLNNDCDLCPDHLHCTGGMGPPQQGAGYFVSFKGIKSNRRLQTGLTQHPTQAVRCSNPLKCPAGRELDVCPPLRRGMACDFCESNHVEDDAGGCRPCDAVSGLWLWLFAMLMTIAVCAFIIAQSLPPKVGSEQQLTIRGVLSSSKNGALMLGALGAVSISWEGPLHVLDPVLRLLRLKIDMLLLPCVLQSHSPLSTLVTGLCMVPFGTTIMVLCYGVIIKVVRACDPKQISLWNAFGVLCGAPFISMAILVLSPWRCLQNPDGSHSMESERSVLCWQDGSHGALIALSIMAILFYLLPFISICLWATWQYPAQSASEAGLSFQRNFKFLFNLWTPASYYFGLINILKQFGVAMVPVVFTVSPCFQVLMFALILMGYGMGQASFSPHRTRTCNQYDNLWAVILVLAIVNGAFLLGVSDADQSDIKSVTMGWLWILGGILVAALIFSVGRAVVTFLAAKKIFTYLSCEASSNAVARWLHFMLMKANLNPYLQVDSVQTDIRRFDVVAYQTTVFVAVCTAGYLPSHYCTGELLAADQANVKTVLLKCLNFNFPTGSTADKLREAWGQRRAEELPWQGLRLDNLRTLLANLDKKIVVTMGQGIDGMVGTGIEMVKVCTGKTVAYDHYREGTLLLICDVTHDAALSGAVVLAHTLTAWLETKVGIPDAVQSTVFEAAKSVLFLLSGTVYQTAWFAEALLESRSKPELKRFFVLTDLGYDPPTSEAFVSNITSGEIFQSDVFDLPVIATAYQEMFCEIPLNFSTNGSKAVQQLELKNFVNKLQFVSGHVVQNLQATPGGTVRIRKVGSEHQVPEKQSSEEPHDQQPVIVIGEGMVLV
jgi:hypothetical protein